MKDQNELNTVTAGFPISDGWVSISRGNQKVEIEMSGSRIILRGSEDILKLRDHLNEIYPPLNV